MLRRVARPISAAVACHAAAAVRVAGTAFSQSVRHMSDDTHDDFKPKVKVNGDDKDEVQKTIEKLVKDHPIFLFMKGTPEQPMCGFSQQAVRILHAHGVDFSSVNVLEHPTIREGVKTYSEWPTIPQLYVDGEFVGGCDIITDLHNDGELEDVFRTIKEREE